MARTLPAWLRSSRVLIGLTVVSIIMFCAIFAPLIAPHDPNEQNLISTLLPPVWSKGSDPAFLLGTDSLGRDVLSRLIYSARVAMLVAVFASLGAMLIGAVLAYIAGYFGGWVDVVIGRAVDVWMSFPPVILSLILMVGLGIGLRNVILAIVLVDWTRFCRVLRGEVLVVARKDYVAAARLLGFSHWRIITREIVPATLPLLITLVSLEMGIAVIVEAILSFVGMSVERADAGLGPDDRRRAAIHLRLAVEPDLSDSGDLLRGVRFQHSGRRLAPHARRAAHRDAAGLTMDMLIARDLAVSAAWGEGHVPVIQELNFALAPGRILGLVGESGAGKSMIGRAIAQLMPPGFAVSRGELMFDGQDLVRMPLETRRELLGREIAFVPQEPLSGLNPVLTIGQQIDEHLARLRIGNRQARRERALAMLDAVHLSRTAELLTKYPHQLSGGMCQRVLIAMAFASRPKLLVADEPTTALDVTIQARIVQLIAEMQEQDGTAVVFITHDLRLAAQICDDILVLYAGRPAEVGPARRVFAQAAHPYTRCLQLSNPSMHGPRRALYALPERMPGLAAIKGIAGCLFAPRCPNVTDECTRALPPFTPVGEGHVAACIHSEQTSTIAAPALAAADAPDSGTPLLAVEGLCKTFRMRSGVFRHELLAAVKDVDFTLHQNEFIGIVGESGSGKSTVARMLCGLEQPSSGSIVIAGARCQRRQRCVARAHARACADGVSGSAIGAQSAPPRRQHRDAGDGGGGRGRPGRAAGAGRGAACRDRPAAGNGRALSGAAFRRSAPARQHRARAVRDAAHLDRRRDRLRARRLGAGATAQFADAAAAPARLLDAVHLARSLGGALFVRPAAGDVSRRGGRERPGRGGFCCAEASLYAHAARRRAAGRSLRAMAAGCGGRCTSCSRCR